MLENMAVLWACLATMSQGNVWILHRGKNQNEQKPMNLCFGLKPKCLS